jgi:hypothetical protein
MMWEERKRTNIEKNGSERKGTKRGSMNRKRR